MNRLLTTISLCCLLVFNLSAQEEKQLKFGKIDMNNLNMTVYDKDSSAGAVVLADKGRSELIRSNTDGSYYLRFERHVRIKILTKDGYGKADIAIPLFSRGGSSELIYTFKAATYNLAGKKVESDKLTRKSFFKERVNERLTNQKFTFPNVKEGSIIEYSYIMTSRFIYNLRDWRFQDDIPTVWSEYIVEIPEYFTYDRFTKGYHGLSINKTKIKRESTRFRKGPLEDLNVYTSHWLAEDVPAFRAEPYMSNVNNYISEINFELSSTEFPGRQIQSFMGTWGELNATFLKDVDFGKIVEGSSFLEDEVSALLVGKETDAEKIQAIVNNVKSRLSWNGKYGKYVTDNLRQRLKKGEGNVADINLLLTNMLRKAGFQADPVLVSTRKHGLVREQFTISSQFNYVVSAVNLKDGSVVLLDATDNTLPSNLLPQRCINGRGWRVSERLPGWIELTSGGMESSLASVTLTLAADGTLSGKSDMVYSDYEARRMRGVYHKDEDKFQENYSENQGWEINNISIEGMDELGESVKLKCDIEVSEGVEILGDLIYLNPIISGKMDENPFKLETREYPVDFISPQLERYIASIKIPEGYAIEELPKSERVTLPEGSGKFSYIINAVDGVISIRSTISINKRLFNSLEYPYLKQFYAKIVEKQAEQIVLKKIN